MCNVKSRTILPRIAVAALLLLGVSAAQAGFEVIHDGSNATGISNLDVGGVFYDIEFRIDVGADIYGAPPEFTFVNQVQAIDANNAVNFALNSVPEVVTVGQGDGLTSSSYAIPYEFQNLEYLVRESEYRNAFNEWQQIAFRPSVPPLSIHSYAIFTPVGAKCTEALDGDLNFDACTDFDDLLVVLDLWDDAGPEGDGNCDGVVDFDDLLLVLNGWSDEGECK